MEQSTDLQHLKDIFALQKQAFSQNPSSSYESRLANLQKLKTMLLEHQTEFEQAISDDFGTRSADDTKIGDFLSTIGALKYTMAKLKKWMKPEKRHVSILFQPATARVEYQPLGVVGIMVPWNYPIFLALGPLITAIAAGNHALIKMSEFTPKTSALLAKLIGLHFPEDLISVIQGDATIASEFSKLRFDHIFFTGSTTVGKYVMKAAAENLVPVTLELGGKSPAIIDNDIEIKTAVERLILGKTLNSGQTCVAPDYIFCPKGKTEELINEFQSMFSSMYPTVDGNNDYTAVVNDAQYQRLQGLVADAKEKGATIVELSKEQRAESSRQMPLTLILNTTAEMKVMQDEIFGPILPILEYELVEEAIAYINERERPLALYIYSFEESFQQQVLKSTHSGGVCINEASFHVAIDDLPFGGVGASGMGNYHGSEGFKTFSHAKAILSKGKINLNTFLFPPFGTAFHKLVYKLFIR